jgi:magnesium transporter
VWAACCAKYLARAARASSVTPVSKPHRHRRFYIRRRTKPGAAPGTVVPDPHAYETKIDMFGYGPAAFAEHPQAAPDLAKTLLEKWPVTWVNVDGLKDIGAVRRIGEIFRLHPLVLEDVVNAHQRAKVEAYGDELFVVARMATLDAAGEVETEQLSIVLGKNFVVTFQERPGDTLGPVRDRIRQGHFLRRSGADYLMYALVDAVVDNYFPVLETYGEHVEALEEEVIAYADEVVLERIHKARRDLLLLRRAIWPQRDALAALYREELPQISEGTRVFLRDCNVHAVQVMDLVESYREMSAALIEVHISQVSNRLNEIMKVLTVFAAVFSPLTFLVGIYGMNFKYMPELDSPWGYPLSLIAMALTAALTLTYFRRKGWIGSSARRRRRHA